MVIDIRCPEDQKILMRGVEDGNIKKFKDAYSIRLTFMDDLKKEISPFTKIKITKDRPTEDTSLPIRCFYTDISKNDEGHLYRPRKNILLQEKEHLFIYVIGEYIGPKLPDVAIDKGHISFSIKADIFNIVRSPPPSVQTSSASVVRLVASHSSRVIALLGEHARATARLCADARSLRFARRQQGEVILRNNRKTSELTI